MKTETVSSLSTGRWGWFNSGNPIFSQVKHTDPQRSRAPCSISSSYLLSSFGTFCLSLSFIFFVLQASRICPPKRHCLFLCFAPAENSHLSISVLKRELLIQLLLLNKQGHLGQCTVCFDHTAFLCVLQQIICVVFPGVVSLKALTMCFIPSGLKQNLVTILSNVN